MDLSDGTEELPDPAMIAAIAQERLLRHSGGDGLAGLRKAGLRAAVWWNAWGPPVPSQDFELAGAQGAVRLRLYRPEAESGAGILLIHGGAFIAGSVEQVDCIARYLAQRTRALVASVGYRLAPENPFPAPIEDCAVALNWLAGADGQARQPSRLAVAGLSAGANLAVATVLRAGLNLSAMMLAYGPYFSANDTPSHQRFGDGRFGLSTARIREGLQLYAGGRDLADPGIDVGQADLAGLPPCHLTIAELDPLRDDSLRLAGLLRAAGVPVALRRWPGMMHGFLNKGRLVPAAVLALDAMADFAAERWSVAAP